MKRGGFTLSKKISVIGAGVAGLASAIRLQHAGYQVTLFEKESTPGGKMNLVKIDGYQFDLGPSIVMMPKVYKEIFELCGRDPDDYIPMEMLDPMYQVYFSDDPTRPMSVSNNLAKWTETLESISQPDTAGFFNYLDDAYLGFSFAWDYILQRPFRKQSDFYNLALLKEGMKTKTGRSADQFVSQYIKNERLKQVISFQTLYIGISPVKSPSFYTMIPMLQFLYGIWFIKGGMYTMTKSMEQLFLELGGTVHYNTDITEILIENKRAFGIRTENEEIKSDFVVCNADFPYAMKQLVQNKQAKGKYTNKKIDKMEYSCSTLVFYLGMDRKYDEVNHVHNFVFSKDFDKNMQDIFSGNKLTNGSFYVYIASKIDASLARLIRTVYTL